MKANDSIRVDCGPCPYLPDRWWHSDAIFVLEITPVEMDAYLERGYQRFGQSLYVPNCTACVECVPIRLDVTRFQPSRTQRRVMRRNRDLRVTVHPPMFTPESYELYRTFMERRFPRSPAPSQEWFAFLLEVHFGFTRQMSYWDGDRLAGFGILDPTPNGAYSYMFAWHWEQEERRLGTFSLIHEVEFCRQTGRRYLYLGLYVQECRSMNYKANFKPYELMNAQGEWEVYGADSAAATESGTG